MHRGYGMPEKTLNAFSLPEQGMEPTAQKDAPRLMPSPLGRQAIPGWCEPGVRVNTLARGEWRWTFECHHGDLTFWSVAFMQYVRRASVLQSSQVLGLQERGGY